MGIKQLHNDNLQKLPNEYRDLSVTSEIKFDLTLKKSNFHFPSLFASIWSCSVCYIGGMILGKNTVLYLENEAK